MNNKELRFSLKAPLNPEDSEQQTFGCRANNPDICKNCYVDNICAFASEDHICKAPSAKWKKYFAALKEDSTND